MIGCLDGWNPLPVTLWFRYKIPRPISAKCVCFHHAQYFHDSVNTLTANTQWSMNYPASCCVCLVGPLSRNFRDLKNWSKHFSCNTNVMVIFSVILFISTGDTDAKTALASNPELRVIISISIVCDALNSLLHLREFLHWLTRRCYIVNCKS